MTKAEAQTILQLPELPDLDDLQDLYDEKLLEVRNQVLRTTAIPTLLASKIKRLKVQGEAFETLLGEHDEGSYDKPSMPDVALGMLDFLRSYEQSLMQVHFKISSAQTAGALVAALESLAELQELYFTRIFEAFAGFYVELSEIVHTEPLYDQEIKITNQLDSGVFIKNLVAIDAEGWLPDQPEDWLNFAEQKDLLEMRYALFSEAIRVQKYMNLKK